MNFCSKSRKKDNSILYGLISGTALVLFYLIVITLFQNFEFAILSFRGSWYLIVPLAAGFGTQVGLYSSIRHSTIVTRSVAGTGAVSAGSIVACCSHFLLNVIPIVSLSGIAVFLVKYQSWLLGVGIVSNIVGIGFMIKHKNGMKGSSI